MSDTVGEEEASVATSPDVEACTPPEGVVCDQSEALEDMLRLRPCIIDGNVLGRVGDGIMLDSPGKNVVGSNRGDCRIVEVVEAEDMEPRTR